MFLYFRRKKLIRRLRALALDLDVDLSNLTDKEFTHDIDIIDRRLNIAHDEIIGVLDYAAEQNKRLDHNWSLGEIPASCTAPISVSDKITKLSPHR